VQVTVADIAAADAPPLAGAGFMLFTCRTDHCPPGMTPEQLEKLQGRSGCGRLGGANQMVCAAVRLSLTT